MKRRLLEGESEESDDWRIGHPVIFPNIFYIAEATLMLRSIAYFLSNARQLPARIQIPW